jgi:hypothetical protein
MSPIPVAQGPATAARRRVRIGAMTAVLVVAATIAVFVLNVLAARANVRWDVTATGEHRLSPRTGAVLAKMTEPHEFVIAGPLSDRVSVDPQARRRVSEVLAQLRRQSGDRVTVTTIDTGSAQGLSAYQELLARLTARESEKISRQSAAIGAAADAAERLSADLDGLAPRLQAVAAAIAEDAPSAATNRAYFEQRAAEARLSARGLRDLAGKARQALQTKLEPLGVPDTEHAAGLIRPALADVQTGLGGIAENLRKFAASETMAAGAREAARPLLDEAVKLRDAAGVARDGLERLGRLDLMRIAGALRGASAALVIGPGGITGVEFASILPAPSAGASRVDYGRIAEELLSTALASLVNPDRPIVVIMHAQTRAAMEKLPFFDAISERMAMHGMDVMTWSVLESADPPPTARVDPSGKRPVVFVVFNTAGFTGGPPGQTGQERVTKLAGAIGKLVEAGKPVLLSVMPSTAPSYGEKDPTAAVLGLFGLEADSGRPILKERLTPEGRRVEAFEQLQPMAGDEPIQRAIKGLPTRLEWPVALRAVSPAPERTRVTPLYQIDDPACWGESQWLGLFQVPMSQHASVPNPPSNDSPRDDAKGPWIVAAAAERTAAALDRPQRLVVVGSNSWFADPVLREATQVDGRLAAANPGNAELFEASVSWLAGQDDLIAQSATARAVPLIRPLSPGLLRLLQWAAIAGLPAVVLGVGAAYRAWRG